MIRKDFDILVIGSGIAGLFYALRVIQANPKTRLAIITKKGEADSSTNWAQGGIAAVLGSDDSFEQHVADTLQVGAGVCHKDVVERVVGLGPQVVRDLESIGVQFTKDEAGNYDLGREGGHSRNRVAHATDLTGKEIERALLKASHTLGGTVTIFEDHMVVDLVVGSDSDGPVCTGASVYSELEQQFYLFNSRVTLLATGGLGQVYFHTTNPRIATGDGVAIAYRAGVAVANLEFIQFHPTSLYAPGRWPFLISEAVRGEGAILKTRHGRPLMKDAHPLGDLAPRDVVARAIDRELKQSGDDFVLLDMSHLPAESVKNRFPNIYAECLKYGFDLTKRAVPVVPAAHYSCGGVLAKLNGETSLRGLYVAGEVAMSGMHGGNRLASNSLLEAVVMARLAAEEFSTNEKTRDWQASESPVPTFHSTQQSASDRKLIAHERQSLQRIMSDFVGIVRNTDRLRFALGRISEIRKFAERQFAATPATYGVLELRNLSTVAELIIQSALTRRESRGLQYLEDIPETRAEFARDTILESPFRPQEIAR